MHFGPVGSEKNSTGGRLPAVVPVRLGTAISATSQPFWLWLSGRGRWRNGGRRKRDKRRSRSRRRRRQRRQVLATGTSGNPDPRAISRVRLIRRQGRLGKGVQG